MPLIKSFRPGRNIYCRSERNVLIRAKQCISYQTKIIIIKCFVRDERNSTISNISSGYDIIYSVFGTCNFYETIYFVFHFVITQHIKNPCVNGVTVIGCGLKYKAALLSVYIERARSGQLSSCHGTGVAETRRTSAKTRRIYFGNDYMQITERLLL